MPNCDLIYESVLWVCLKMRWGLLGRIKEQSVQLTGNEKRQAAVIFLKLVLNCRILEEASERRRSVISGESYSLVFPFIWMAAVWLACDNPHPPHIGPACCHLCSLWYVFSTSCLSGKHHMPHHSRATENWWLGLHDLVKKSYSDCFLNYCEIKSVAWCM